MLNTFLWAGLLAANCAASPPLQNTPEPEGARLRVMLQAFVDASWGSRFTELGEESDFDHGHLLRDARTGAVAAILYHTRELTVPAPAERSWIQWLDGRVESAARYERASYPVSASWDWFVARDLPRLKRRHTIVERMLDPERLGVEVVPGGQWTFERTACSSAGPEILSISLPDRTSVCLKSGLM